LQQKIKRRPQNLQHPHPMKVLHTVRAEVEVLLKEAVQIQKVYVTLSYRFVMLLQLLHFSHQYKFQRQHAFCFTTLASPPPTEGLVCHAQYLESKPLYYCLRHLY
jgi:hypothetical protein